jgi:hypothetical protein
VGKKKTATSRQKAKRARTEKPTATLESVVGSSTYNVWVDMLKRLVPGSRTHRLAPLVAGMLQYAADRANQRSRGALREGSVAAALLNATEHEDDDPLAEDLPYLVERLFRDAGVRSSRADRRGDRYSLVDAAIQEFVRWESMPWE